MRVHLTLFIVFQLFAAVYMAAINEDDTIDYKGKYLKIQIDNLQLLLENSRLQNENYELSKQIATLITERENCSTYADNINSISSSLSNIQRDLWPIKTHYDLKYNTNNNRTDQEKLLIENTVKFEQLLNEIKGMKDNFTSVAAHFHEISVSLNASLTEFKNVTKTVKNHEASNNLLNTTKSVAEQSVLNYAQTETNDNLQVTSMPIVFDKDNWIVFLRRINGSVNFQRTWVEYKSGFGDVNGNYFMGLQMLYNLTSSGCYEMKVILEDFDKEQKYALYDQFGISSEDEGYALNTLGSYSGTAGDSLLYHKNMKWTSIDRDNDKRDDVNCAEEFQGGWWHNVYTHSKLTGLYLPGGHDQFSQGIEWYTWSLHYSFKTAKMLIRKKAC